MEIHTVNAQIRNAKGKGASRSLRREGKIPAILYGSDIESIPLSVSAYDIENLLKKISYSQALINLVESNSHSFEKKVMIREIQADPVNQKYLHLDFYEVKMDRKITATVPIITKGTAKGVTTGGILQIIRRELDVVCFPAEIPQRIEVDITDLDIGDSIHVKDIRLEGDVEIPFDSNFTVITVVSPKVEEAPKAEEEEAEKEEEEKEAAAEPGE